jgi:hypothetical protein
MFVKESHATGSEEKRGVWETVPIVLKTGEHKFFWLNAITRIPINNAREHIFAESIVAKRIRNR